MKALLKKNEVPKTYKNVLRHPIRMFFVESEESDELYCFGTTVEEQFCTKDEYDIIEGLSKEQFDKKINYANSLVGKKFEINFYKFTVKELTGNKYVAFEFENVYYDFSDFVTIVDYHIASYMTKEDVISNLKHIITMQGLQRTAKGILSDGSKETITTDLFFPKPVPEIKQYIIPYGKYPNLTNNHIVNEIDINEIRKGYHLANRIKGRIIPEYDFDRYICQIEDYRSKVSAAKITNESLRKKVLFWQPKLVVEELKLDSNFISIAIDSIILSRLYPSDCEEARKEYVAGREKRMREKYMHENVDENEFKDKFYEFRKVMRKKYQGKSVVKVVT